jgi:CRISPR/Cas system-associated exonuclease Cas4 (RecB family)
VEQVAAREQMAGECVKLWTPEGLSLDYDWQEEEMEQGIFLQEINNIIVEYPNDRIAILARTNRDLKRFSAKLYRQHFSFEGKLQFLFEEDKFFQLMSYFSTVAIQKNFLLSSLEALEILFKSNKTFSWIEVYESWLSDCQYLGFDFACAKLMESTGIYPTSHEVLSMIKQCYVSAEGSYSTFVQKLNTVKKKNFYSVISSLGKNKIPIILQTIHGSKGLQYEHVFITRVDKNQRDRSHSQLFGTKLSEHRILYPETAKSPCLLETEKLHKINQEEESLRLFYVACTRAIKSIHSVVFEQASSAKKSWGKNLRSLNSMSSYLMPLIIPEGVTAKNAPLDSYLLASYLGSNKDSFNALELKPDLSVTGLTQYSACPRRFYYAQLLGLDESNDFFSTKKEIVANTPGVSSSERGSNIHKRIQKLLEEKKCLPENFPCKKFWDAPWHELLDKNIYSELELRFKWRDQMLIGAPDLFFFTGSQLTVIDFKTGKVEDSSLRAYKTQLLLYSHAIIDKFTHIKIDGISCQIWSLDEGVIHHCHYRYDNVQQELDKLTFSVESYKEKKLDHCSKCPYQVLCHD